MKNKIIIFFLLIVITTLVYFAFFNKNTFKNHSISITDIKNIGKVFVEKSHISTIVRGTLDDTKSLYIVKGEAYYYINLKDIVIKYLDNKHSVVNIILDRPLIEYKLNIKDTRIFSVKTSSMIKLENIRANIIDKEFRALAEEKIKKLSKKEEYIKIARRYSKDFLKKYFGKFDIKINRIYWKDLTPETLDENIIKNARYKLLSKLLICNKENKLKKLAVKYNIKQNGSIDKLILDNKLNKELKTCIENALYKFKYREFYGDSEVKIEDTFDLDKDKLCETLAQDIYKLGNGHISLSNIKRIANKKFSKNSKLNKKIEKAKKYMALNCKKLYLKKESSLYSKTYFKEDVSKQVMASPYCSIDLINIYCIQETGKSHCDKAPLYSTKTSFRFGGYSRGKGVSKGELKMKAEWRESCLYK